MGYTESESRKIRVGTSVVAMYRIEIAKGQKSKHLECDKKIAHRIYILCFQVSAMYFSMSAAVAGAAAAAGSSSSAAMLATA